MKRFVIIVAVLLIVACLFGVATTACAAETFSDDGFEYRVTGRKKVEIIGYNGTDTEPSISSSVNGYDIVGIADSAFKNNHTITGFVIWANLEYIGDLAFYNCTALTEMSIPSDIKNIGESAFEGCTSLSDVTFWGGETIGKYAFKNCVSLTEVSLPSSMKSIGNSAFEGCSSLTEYFCWNDDIKIGDNAFAGCPLSKEKDNYERADVEPNEGIDDEKVTYSEYTVKIHIDFIPNLFFSTYNVKLLVNGDVELILSHGEDRDLELTLPEGTHTIKFVNEDDSSVYGKTELEVKSDLDASYKIACYSEKVDVEIEYVDSHVEISPDEVKMQSDKYAFHGEDYESVVNTLKELGFTNVSTVPLYDIYWGWTEEGAVEDVIIAGIEDYKRGHIFNKDAEVVVTYHLKEEDDPAKVTVQIADPPVSTSTVKPTEEPLENLTVDNCELLAQLLEAKNPNSLITSFMLQYQGRIIEFDGNIAYMSKHGNYNTRFDILIYAGDYSETSAVGPNFQFRDVNYIDLGLTGRNVPDSVHAGQNYHIIAEVVRYDSTSELLMLEPISMELR